MSSKSCIILFFLCGSKIINCFSSVCFIGSVPSTGSGEVRQWGLGRLKFLLQKYVPADAAEAEWPALIQCSSIGSLGITPSEWVESQMKSAMLGSTNSPTFKTPLRLVRTLLF
jgi:Tyrosyl-DNA phosphodiesterase